MAEFTAVRTFSEQLNHFRSLINTDTVTETDMNVLKTIVKNNNELPKDFTKEISKETEEYVQSLERLERLGMWDPKNKRIPTSWFDVIHAHVTQAPPPLTPETAEKLHALQTLEDIGTLNPLHKAMLTNILRRGNVLANETSEVLAIFDHTWQMLSNEQQKKLASDVQKRAGGAIEEGSKEWTKTRNNLLTEHIRQLEGLGIINTGNKQIQQPWITAVLHWVGSR